MKDTYTRRKSVRILGENEECRRVVVELLNRESRAKGLVFVLLCRHALLVAQKKKNILAIFHISKYLRNKSQVAADVWL